LKRIKQGESREELIARLKSYIDAFSKQHSFDSEKMSLGLDALVGIEDNSVFAKKW
jgi:hypothetical protein